VLAGLVVASRALDFAVYTIIDGWPQAEQIRVVSALTIPYALFALATVGTLVWRVRRGEPTPGDRWALGFELALLAGVGANVAISVPALEGEWTFSALMGAKAWIALLGPAPWIAISVGAQVDQRATAHPVGLAALLGIGLYIGWDLAGVPALGFARHWNAPLALLVFPATLVLLLMDFARPVGEDEPASAGVTPARRVAAALTLAGAATSLAEPVLGPITGLAVSAVAGAAALAWAGSLLQPTPPRWAALPAAAVGSAAMAGVGAWAWAYDDWPYLPPLAGLEHGLAAVDGAWLRHALDAMTVVTVGAAVRSLLSDRSAKRRAATTLGAGGAAAALLSIPYGPAPGAITVLAGAWLLVAAASAWDVRRSAE